MVGDLLQNIKSVRCISNVRWQRQYASFNLRQVITNHDHELLVAVEGWTIRTTPPSTISVGPPLDVTLRFKCGAFGVEVGWFWGLN